MQKIFLRTLLFLCNWSASVNFNFFERFRKSSSERSQRRAPLVHRFTESLKGVKIQRGWPVTFLLIFIFLKTEFSTANPYDYPISDTSELKGKIYNPKNEVKLSLGYSPNGVFNHLNSIAGSYTKKYTFSKAWEIIDFNILGTSKSLLGKKIHLIQNLDLDYPKELVLSNFVFTPLYGKAFFNDHFISMTEVSALFGFGYLVTDKSMAPVLNLGLKGQWTVTKNHNLRIDLKYIKTVPSKTYFESFLFISAGWVYGF